jgi:(1->4)-alpha-D-glucan 1-alpha-D-glucosylmutase
VQLNRDFDFLKLKNVVPYLAKLGISHIYASPIFKARTGSSHGYDIVDPTAFNDELGGKAAFEELAQTVDEYGLGWVQDIVPNHAAYSLENKRVFDVLQNGQNSRYSKFFDVDWNHPSTQIDSRILTPFLGRELAECVKQGEITLGFDDGIFKIRYDNLEFPLNNNSTQELLREKDVSQTRKRYNSDPTLLTSLISNQFYALTYWKNALKEINYRRFFDILDLIGLRMEDQDAFDETHQLIFELLCTEVVTGLRVDHIDGLYDPEQYLQNLRRRFPDTYFIVEKILTDDEGLPECWPVQGSTGYDFVNQVNGLFVKQANETAIDDLFKRFTGNTQTFGDLLFDCKMAVIEAYFLGDIENLARLINQTFEKIALHQFDNDKMPNAISTLIACFPVYRTYVNPENPIDKKGYFNEELNQAKQRKPELTEELDVIRLLLGQCKVNSEALHAVMRLQQFTGAIMAKGFEDTTLYRYSRLLSLNEVGGNPAKFGVSTDEFDQFNVSRHNHWPLTLNAGSTHDTKRGEDARARLNVLSEMPQELERHLYKWAKTNLKHKTKINGDLAPNRNEEYFVYQTILGAYPFEEYEMKEFNQRVTAYMVKALREAKIHTSWLNQNKQYENATEQFINQILSDQTFLEDFLPFQYTIAQYGVINTLAQTLLKITCPGVPDFYQGSELWNLSMVDPDNRRPVDYQKRNQILAEISELDSSDVKGLLRDVSGKAKLYVIWKALQVRHKLRVLFEKGSYSPLTVEGELKGHVFAFMRKWEGKFVVVVVPRFLVGLYEPSDGWMVDWKDTSVKLPSDVPSSWKDTFTTSYLNKSGQLSVGEVLSGFPVALLVGGTSS